MHHLCCDGLSLVYGYNWKNMGLNIFKSDYSDLEPLSCSFQIIVFFKGSYDKENYSQWISRIRALHFGYSSTGTQINGLLCSINSFQAHCWLEHPSLPLLKKLCPEFNKMFPLLIVTHVSVQNIIICLLW